MARKRIAELSKGVGKPKVGGPLTGLVDHNGKTINDDEFMGKYRLVGTHALLGNVHTLCERTLIYWWERGGHGGGRYTLDSHIALTSARKSWTKWQQ